MRLFTRWSCFIKMLCVFVLVSGFSTSRAKSTKTALQEEPQFPCGEGEGWQGTIVEQGLCLSPVTSLEKCEEKFKNHDIKKKLARGRFSRFGKMFSELFKNVIERNNVKSLKTLPKGCFLNGRRFGGGPEFFKRGSGKCGDDVICICNPGCFKCPSNYFLENRNGSPTCKECPSYKPSTNSVADGKLSSCKACPPGKGFELPPVQGPLLFDTLRQNFLSRDVTSKNCVTCLKNYFSRGSKSNNFEDGPVVCEKCPEGRYSDAGSSDCYDPNTKRHDKMFEDTHNKIKQIAKAFSASKNYEQEINSGQVNKLQRMIATTDVRRDYDVMREKHEARYQRHGKVACMHEEKDHNTKRRVQIISAIPLHDEVDDKTCLRINRDELVSAFCNFRADFDKTLSKHNLGNAKRFWPNFCCASTGDTCNSTKVKLQKMVPFALAQGGKVTKTALYGELLDMLSAKKGYLLKGMLNVLKEVRGSNTALNDEINQVFKQIHLCGPRVFQSPVNDAVKMCQLFHPYAQLMSSFHKKFKGLFTAKHAKNILVPQSSSFLEITRKIRANKQPSRLAHRPRNNNVCRLKLASKKELDEKKKVFCSMFQPFDITDERIVNIAMFHIRKDIGRDEKFVKVLSENARFIVGDKCFQHSPMFSGNDVSLQHMEVEGKKEWVLLAKLDSSAKGYFRTDAENCVGRYLPRVTVNFGIYVDKSNCCENTKNVASCQSCNSETAPTPLDHHWTNEQLFYEMTVTGTKFKLELDGNPILMGTKYTYLQKTNSIKPTDSVGGKVYEAVIKVLEKKIKRRRRLLGGWTVIWEEFTKLVETTQGTCNSEILQDVQVADSGEISFKCSKAKALCTCIQHVGSSGEEQQFSAGDMGLNVFHLDGTVSYEILDNGKSVGIIGDVNEGNVEGRSRRRRRLMRSGAAGGRRKLLGRGSGGGS